VFALDTSGPTTTTVYDFSATNGPSFTNSDGANPVCVLVLSGNTLYGTTQYGGANGNGTVFAVNTGSTGFGALYDFNPVVENGSAIPTIGLSTWLLHTQAVAFPGGRRLSENVA